MNKVPSAVFALALPLFVLLTGCGAGHHAPCVMPQGSVQATRSITVVGQGEAKGKPDIARTSLGVEAVAPTVQEAMDQTNAKMNAIIAALKKNGITENDIKTANFTISMERPYNDAMPVPSPYSYSSPSLLAAPPKPGTKAAAPPVAAPPAAAPVAAMPPMPSTTYRINNTVEVIVRDVAKTSAILQAAVDAGANNVWNVSFGLDDMRPLEAGARAKAVEDARARAEALAKLEGLKLGKVISVSEIIGRGMMPLMPMMSAEAKFGGGPALAMGEASVGMSVEVVFGLEP